MYIFNFKGIINSSEVDITITRNDNNIRMAYDNAFEKLFATTDFTNKPSFSLVLHTIKRDLHFDEIFSVDNLNKIDYWTTLRDNWLLLIEETDDRKYYVIENDDNLKSARFCYRKIDDSDNYIIYIGRLVVSYLPHSRQWFVHRYDSKEGRFHDVSVTTSLYQVSGILKLETELLMSLNETCVELPIIPNVSKLTEFE